ncbi:hypothetical protein ABVT39_004496 [Epinephelus coioides]
MDGVTALGISSAGSDHAEDSVQQPPACKACQVRPKFKEQQCWNPFRRFDMMLCSHWREPELEMNDVETPTSTAITLPLPPVVPFKTTAFFLDDDNITSVAGTFASHLSTPSTFLAWYCRGYCICSACRFASLCLDAEKHKQCLVTIPSTVQEHPEVVKQMWTYRCNIHCPLWFSLVPHDELPLGEDTSACAPWPRKLISAILPLHLIPPLLERMSQMQLLVMLITPGCHSVPWYLEMVAAKPWTIPQLLGSLS